MWKWLISSLTHTCSIKFIFVKSSLSCMLYGKSITRRQKEAGQVDRKLPQKFKEKLMATWTKVKWDDMRNSGDRKYLIWCQAESEKWRGFARSDGKESACNAGDASLIPGLEDPLEKEMETCSSILAWRIVWTEEPGVLQSMGSQRVR